MRALVLRDYMQFDYTEVPDPVPQQHEVLVKVQAVGICGSDVHGARGESGRRIPPLIMGHEAAGEVVQPMAGGEFHAGDHVVMDSTVSCGACAYCRSGTVNLCEQRRVLGVSCGDYRRDGAMAQYVVVPERCLYRLPDEVAFSSAALVEPAAVALHALRKAGPRQDVTLLVMGAGTIGLLLVHLAKVMGYRRVLAVDVDDWKLEMARTLGADDVIHAQAEGLVAAVLECNGGRPVDVVIEAVGLERTVAMAVRCVKRGGAMILVGNLASHVSLPLQLLVSCEITLCGSCACRDELPMIIELLTARRLDTAPFLSAIAPLSEGGRWFQRLAEPDHQRVLKVVLEPWRT